MVDFKKYLGIPYKHQGKDASGLDCWTFIKYFYKQEFGIELWDINADYDEHWSWEGRDYFLENYGKEWDKVAVPQVFDAVFLQNVKGIMNHGGIYIGGGRMMHCCKQGVLISPIAKWNGSVNGYYHLRGFSGRS